MNNLERMIKQRVKEHGMYKPLLRIKIGKALAVYAALPLFSAWAFLIAVPLMIPLSFPVWVKSKIIDFKTWRQLR